MPRTAFKVDLDRRPDLALRYGIAATPTMMVIRRGTRQRMVIANGVEAYPGLAQGAFQAVRLLTGEIRPEQFLTGPGEEGGFFDALANGPVAATEQDVAQGSLHSVANRRPCCLVEDRQEARFQVRAVRRLDGLPDQ